MKQKSRKCLLRFYSYLQVYLKIVQSFILFSQFIQKLAKRNKITIFFALLLFVFLFHPIIFAFISISTFRKELVLYAKNEFQFESLNRADQFYNIQVVTYQTSKKDMKGATMNPKLPYLDISELLLKQHSPCYRPKIPEDFQVQFIESYLKNTSLLNIHDESSSNMGPLFTFFLIQAASPLNTPFCESPHLESLRIWATTPLNLGRGQTGHTVLEELDISDLNTFILEEPSLQGESLGSKKGKKSLRPRLNSTWHFVDRDLELIVGQEQQNEVQRDQPDEQVSEQEDSHENQSYEEEDQKCYQEQKQSTTNFDLILSQEPLFLEWHNANPKKQLLSKLKSICSGQSQDRSQQKLQEIKSAIGSYIFDHERYYFEESMNNLKGNLSSIFNTLAKGIEQNFNRKIGGLSFERRRLKLVKYIEKKKYRVWRKKVNYDCRKKVADGRLRIKGKFVTYEQAREQLGVSLEGYGPEEIRNLLEKKCDS